MLTDTLYKKVLKPVLFKLDPEDVHNRFTRVGKLMGATALSRALIRALYYYDHPSLHNTVAGIHFNNPIGLAAGFDKNAQLADILPEIGFGFAELGSVTGEPCQGNPRPRLFRVPDEKSIIVNYGLYNQGCEAIAKRLNGKKFHIPIGMSVAKTNDPRLSIQDGVDDYLKAFRYLHSIGAYTTINVSCPNTSDGITYQDPKKLALLLNALNHESHTKPIFLKIKSDFTNEELAEIVDIANKYDWVTGFIISNLRTNRVGLHTSKDQLDRLSQKGGLSGLPVKDQSTKVIRFVRKKTDKIIIGCGGIFTGKDAYEKLKAGASLLQLVTALIYEGPGVISRINRELVDLMQRDGYGRISEVIADAK